MTERDPLEPIIEVLREPAGLAPGLSSRVLAEIARDVAPAPARRAGWWRRRWTIQVSPAGALAFAAALAAVLVGSRMLSRPAAPPAGASVAASTPVQVTQFVLVAPGAASVSVVGDFNDWSLSATPLQRAEGDGVWSVTIPLAPGRYRYSFVVDGTVWKNDPESPALDDEFGRPNSVVTVGGA